MTEAGDDGRTSWSRGYRTGANEPDYEELGGALAGAVVNKLTKNVQDTIDRIVEHVSPDVELPARLEDLEAAAYDIVEGAMPMIRDALERLAEALLRSLMNPE